MALADELLAVLDDPTHMWSHALKELSPDAQRLFLTLPLLPSSVSSDDLQIAYTSQAFNKTETFLDSLRALEDSFISIYMHGITLRVVRFRNPSLADFAQAYLNQYPDWLDSLLSAPVFFEQVMLVFGFAMAREEEDGRERLKYPGIRSWVENRSQHLVRLGVELRESRRPRVRFEAGQSSPAARLGQLLEILREFGLPTDSAIKVSFRDMVRTALDATDQASAETMTRLLKDKVNKQFLDSSVEGDAAAVLRSSVLDRDAWKYSILSQLDAIMELDSETSMEDWGRDYLGYATQLVEDVIQSDNADDVWDAMKEFENIGDFLGVYMGDEIARLQERYDEIPQDEDDYEDSTSSKTSYSAADAFKELDYVFGSLLEES